MFFGVVEPMPGFPCDDESVDLVSFDPDDLVNSPVPPFGQALSPEFHGSSRNPQKYQPLILQNVNSQIEQLLIFEGSVR